MKVLIACEESQEICKAFRALGHEAYSCDIQDCSGGHPEWHIKKDVRQVIKKQWDMMIGHPVCTFMCRHRSRWNHRDDTQEGQEKGKNLFMDLWQSYIPLIALENPVPLKGMLPPYTQIIQPWQFGHDYSKKTCLWLKGLPKLIPTKIVDITYYTTPKGRRFTYGWYMTPRNSKARSKTFLGIAEAMADQWGNL